MFKRLLPLLLLLLSFRVFALDFPIEISESIDDTKIVACINQDELSKQAKWTPFESTPPLSVSDALAAIRNYIKPQMTDAQLVDVELKQIPHHASYWHYLVEVNTSSNNTSKPQFFVVLMDGKVISAIKEPDAIK